MIYRNHQQLRIDAHRNFNGARIALYLLFMVLNGLVSSTGSASATDTQIAFEHSLKKSLIEILGRYISFRDFRVGVQAQLKADVFDMPDYLPVAGSNVRFDNLPLNGLLRFAQDVKVDIGLSAKFEPSARDQFRRLIILEASPVPQNLSFTVSVNDLDISIPSDVLDTDPKVLEEMLAIKSEIRANSDQIEKLKEKIDENETKMLDADSRMNEMAEKQQELAEKTTQNQNISPAENAESSRGFFHENRIFLFFLALLAIVAMVLSPVLISKAYKVIGNAVNSVAEAMQSVGGVLSSSLSNQDSGSTEPTERELGSSGEFQLPPLPLNIAKDHLARLREEILESLSNSNESFLTDFLISRIKDKKS